MRLRSLRKLEEMELRTRARRARPRRRASSTALLGSEKRQWKTVAWRDQGGRARRSARTRRSASAARRSPTPRRRSRSTSPRRMVEREPITVVLSEKGWIRALRGHVAGRSGLAFKADDR